MPCGAILSPAVVEASTLPILGAARAASWIDALMCLVAHWVEAVSHVRVSIRGRSCVHTPFEEIQIHALGDAHMVGEVLCAP